MQYILFLLCLFELLCVPAVFLKLSLSALTAVYLVAVIVATGGIIWKRKSESLHSEELLCLELR